MDGSASDDPTNVIFSQRNYLLITFQLNLPINKSNNEQHSNIKVI